MTSAFDDGAPDWAPEFDTTTALDDDPVMEQHDVQSEGPRFGSTISYEELTNPDTGNSLEWEVSEGWKDAGTGEPVDYWKSEST